MHNGVEHATATAVQDYRNWNLAVQQLTKVWLMMTHESPLWPNTLAQSHT